MSDKENTPIPFEKSIAIDQIPREKEDFLVNFFSLPPDFFEIAHSLLLWTFITAIGSQIFWHNREHLGDAFWLPILPLILLFIAAAFCQHKNPEIQPDITVRLVFVAIGIGLGVM